MNDDIMIPDEVVCNDIISECEDIPFPTEENVASIEESTAFEDESPQEEMLDAELLDFYERVINLIDNAPTLETESEDK